MIVPRRKNGYRRRTCRYCRQSCTPDPRNRWHQRYCSRPECRHAGKLAAQRRRPESEKGESIFPGSDNLRQVQQLRAAHPRYWKRSETKQADGLQDIAAMQPALLVGLTANLTGNTLQDHIAGTARRLVISGKGILGSSLGPSRKGSILHGGQKDSLSGSSSPCSQVVQLGGSSPGA